MSNLNPTSPLGFLLMVLETRVDHARQHERGASAVEWVVISAIVVTIVLAVGLLLRNALEGKAGSISSEIEGA